MFSTATASTTRAAARRLLPRSTKHLFSTSTRTRTPLSPVRTVLAFAAGASVVAVTAALGTGPGQPLFADAAESPMASKLPRTEYARDAPGLYVWGSNATGLVDPKTAPPVGSVSTDPTADVRGENCVKRPQRIKFFDGVALRGVVFGDDVAVAIDTRGDVFQWGHRFAPTARDPIRTLTGLDIVQVHVARDALFALSRAGTLYMVPIEAAAQAQMSGTDPLALPRATPATRSESPKASSSWWPFGRSAPSAAAKTWPTLAVQGDSIADVRAGDDHVVVRTKKGDVFSAALAPRAVAAGALGRGVQPGEAQVDEDGNVDRVVPQLHKVEVVGKVDEIAAGAAHSLARTSDGRVWAWGTNTHGQLCLGTWTKSTEIVPLPTEIHPRKDASVQSITAAGQMSAFVTTAPTTGTTNVLVCGNGQFGTLGHGQYIHVQPSAVTVKEISNRTEYNELAKKLVPIGIRTLALGPYHAAAVLQGSMAPLGNDVLFWGAGTCYATAQARRKHLAMPVPGHPLPWRFGEGHADVENGDGVDRMLVRDDQEVVVGPTVSCVYSKA
ncbi:hypothetical protein AMAG_13477 [Allomyces macrogynus ATCC 38327]|uniref:Uncharacterized protein n=1 Tax=Allomyces macrogynus (strain ATCC 38327) TaxID=578462 RepID=A0A0L0T1W3_ALLM3|nr:hypothetical protein AMAG_13477 [Allomyces macrogynus ATCC 38327]|eukprot:KNE68838.1 hypothetical protein AMAG_13477 [Allomyces macrogynus ATCC 38327]